MTPEQFDAYAGKGYNRIPVHREVYADLDTPLSTYLKLADGPYSYLLESVQGGEKWGRYSIIGLPARERLRVTGHEIVHESDDGVIEALTAEDPLAYIEAFQARYHSPDLPDMPRFNGGLVGYFGYDTVRYIEPRLHDSVPADELGTPDILLMVSDEVVVFDNLRGKLHLIVQASPARSGSYGTAVQRLDELETQLRETRVTSPVSE
ncbi:MAG: anthranilate synthase component I, partial [Gammaproteobacteria bacterium]|nr:anthranilate synthase component I [Gammaproteobacteria bacterium]